MPETSNTQTERELYVRAVNIIPSMAEKYDGSNETRGTDPGADYDNYFGYGEKGMPENMTLEKIRTINVRYRILASVGAVPPESILLAPMFFLEDSSDEEVDMILAFYGLMQGAAAAEA